MSLRSTPGRARRPVAPPDGGTMDVGFRVGTPWHPCVIDNPSARIDGTSIPTSGRSPGAEWGPSQVAVEADSGASWNSHLPNAQHGNTRNTASPGRSVARVPVLRVLQF